MNAYSYAHNNPVTKSDPTGLRPDGPVGGHSMNDERWAKDRGMNAGYTKKGSRWVWKQTPRKDKASQRRYRAYRANPAHYLIDDSYARKRAAQAAAHRAKVDAMLKAQAKKRADAERRKKDGIFGSLKKGLDWAGTTAKNAASGAKKWAKDHKTTIAGVAAGVGCGIAIASVAGVGLCGVIAGAAVGVGAWQYSHRGSTDAGEAWSYISQGTGGAALGSGIGAGMREGMAALQASRAGKQAAEKAKQAAGEADKFWDQFYKNYM
jgi:hypothetical protein